MCVYAYIQLCLYNCTALPDHEIKCGKGKKIKNSYATKLMCHPDEDDSSLPSTLNCTLLHFGKLQLSILQFQHFLWIFVEALLASPLSQERVKHSSIHRLDVCTVVTMKINKSMLRQLHVSRRRPHQLLYVGEVVQ